MKRRILLGLALLAALVLVGPYVIPLPAQPDRAPDDVAPPGGRFLTVAGVRTFVQEAGPAEGPAVVLVHGFGGSTFNWRYTLPALAEAGYHSIALDLKGFGLSDKRFDEDYSHAAQADFVAEVMTALNVQSATLVGHSMGGNVVAHFALKYPQRVDGLVFAAGMVITGRQGRGPAFGLPASVGPLVAFPPLRRWGQLVLRAVLVPARVTTVLASAYYDSELVTPEVVEGALRPQQVRGWDLALLGLMRDSGRNALPEPVSAITAPTLLAWGANDSWVPLERGQQLRSALPQAQWVVIPRAGHLLMEEQAEAFDTALLDFLRTSAARR
jgi:pimeloyl-ACP methyl ester carboxylesterase